MGKIERLKHFDRGRMSPSSRQEPRRRSQRQRQRQQRRAVKIDDDEDEDEEFEFEGGIIGGTGAGRVLKYANSVRNPLFGLSPRLSRVELSEGKARITFEWAPLEPRVQARCLDLFRENMGELYRRSSWGLDMKQKAAEFSHGLARFLLVSLDKDDKDLDPSNIIAFASFRFEPHRPEDYKIPPAHGPARRSLQGPAFHAKPAAPKKTPAAPQAPIIYLYELQIQSSYHRHGIGKHLLTLLEIIAIHVQINKIMLTVFLNNQNAINFYLNRGYALDKCTPGYNLLFPHAKPTKRARQSTTTITNSANNKTTLTSTQYEYAIMSKSVGSL